MSDSKQTQQMHELINVIDDAVSKAQIAGLGDAYCMHALLHVMRLTIGNPDHE